MLDGNSSDEVRLGVTSGVVRLKVWKAVSGHTKFSGGSVKRGACSESIQDFGHLVIWRGGNRILLYYCFCWL